MPEPALRTSVARSDASGHFFRVVGADAFELVDALLPTELFLQEAQLRQTLLLDDAGYVLADALVGRDDDAFLLMIDGLSRQDARSLLAAHLVGSGSQLEDLAEPYEPIGLHGPYAWELLGEWLSPDFIGMPYLSSFRAHGVLVLRSGRTGEYGYDVLLPKTDAAALLDRLEQLRETFDVGVATRNDLDLAALENGFFNVRREGQWARDPLELQLRWRLSKDKAYRGRDALLTRWNQGVRRRITWLTSQTPLSVGTEVELLGQAIGPIVNAAEAPLLGAWLGIAALETRWACAGIDAFQCAGAPVRTVAPPVINNLSLHVNPQRHGYRERDRFVFPDRQLRPLL